MDCGPPGSSLHGISQARILQWVAISFPRGSFWPRDLGCVSCIRQEDSLPLSHQGSPTETHRIKNKLEMHIKLILKFYLFIYRYLAVSALSCSTQDLHCVTWDLSSKHRDSLCVVLQLGYSTACGILVSQPGIKDMCPALEGGFITTRPPGRSLRLVFFKAT